MGHVVRDAGDAWSRSVTLSDGMGSGTPYVNPQDIHGRRVINQGHRRVAGVEGSQGSQGSWACRGHGQAGGAGHQGSHAGGSQGFQGSHARVTGRHLA
jgi:hypothetical protein